MRIYNRTLYLSVFTFFCRPLFSRIAATWLRVDVLKGLLFMFVGPCALKLSVTNLSSSAQEALDDELFGVDKTQR